MIFIYVFYLDVFLEQNLLMNLIVLSLTYVLFKTEYSLKIWRIMAAALFGSVFFLLCLLLGPGYRTAMALYVFLGVPAMIFAAYGFRTDRLFFNRVGSSLFSVVLLNGVAEAVQNLTGVRILTLYSSVLTLMLALFTIGFWRKEQKIRAECYPVHLWNQGREIACMGFYDTGNRLTMPGMKEPVHIICSLFLKEWGALAPKPVMDIPFHSLGSREGRLPVVQIERMEIWTGQGVIRIDHVWCGVDEQKMLRCKPYRMILNADVFRAETGA